MGTIGEKREIVDSVTEETKTVGQENDIETPYIMRQLSGERQIPTDCCFDVTVASSEDIRPARQVGRTLQLSP